MSAIAFSQLRKRLTQIAEEAAAGEPVYITRSDGSNLVLISAKEGESIRETAHLLSSPANAGRLMESRKQAKAGRLVERDIG